MIIDFIENRSRYYCLGSDYQTALDFFAEKISSNIEKGNITLDNGAVTVKCRPMSTKAETECTFEAHDQFTDIHFVTYGVEQIGFANRKDLTELSVDKEKDVITLSGKGEKLTLSAGWFMICFPQDAHMPCIAEKDPAPLGKMIAKIREK